MLEEEAHPTVVGLAPVVVDVDAPATVVGVVEVVEEEVVDDEVVEEDVVEEDVVEEDVVDEDEVVEDEDVVDEDEVLEDEDVVDEDELEVVEGEVDGLVDAGAQMVVEVAPVAEEPPDLVVVVASAVVDVDEPLTVKVAELPAWVPSSPTYAPVTVTAEAGVGENFTVQLPLARVQAGLLNVPEAEGALKATVPAGVDFVPTSLSATVAVHVVEVPTATAAGEHPRVVVVARPAVPTVTEPSRPACVESPLYCTPSLTIPVAAALNVSVQLPDVTPAEAAGREQLALPSVPAPVGAVKVTVPVGVVAVPASVSLTVAVQVDGLPNPTVVQETSRVVTRSWFAVTVTVPKLVECVASPP